MQIQLSCPKCGALISVTAYSLTGGSVSTTCPKCKRGITVNHDHGRVTKAY